MSTPAYAELVAAVRREGEAIVAAGRTGVDIAVPTCGEWRIADLLAHVASVYHRAATAVGERATEAVPWSPPPGDAADPVGVLVDALDELVHALSAADADSPAWNWSGRDQTAAFWARRMTHESTVHRYDAQRAHGVAQPIDADLAYDGMDELVDVIGPRVLARDGRELPAATYRFVATESGEWPVRTGPGGIERVDVVRDPDVTVRGTTSALLLAAYHRVPWTNLAIDGDAALLDAWTDALRF